MHGLNEIRSANRKATRQGNMLPDTVKVYDVYYRGKKIKSGVTIGQCADIRSIQGECKFKAT